jgi:hypothetical protein
MNTPSTLATEAKVFAEARLAAVRSGQGAVTAEPTAATNEAIDETLGQYGAVTLRELNTGGKNYPAGSLVPAEVVMQWKPQNRAILQRQKRVVYLTKPIAANAAPVTAAG